MDTETKKTKTFKEVVAFDENLEKEEDCWYLYTCPPIYPYAIEFKTYEEKWIQPWVKRDTKWEITGGISRNINMDAALSDEWEGFKLIARRNGDC